MAAGRWSVGELLEALEQAGQAALPERAPQVQATPQAPAPAAPSEILDGMTWQLLLSLPTDLQRRIVALAVSCPASLPGAWGKMLHGTWHMILRAPAWHCMQDALDAFHTADGGQPLPVRLAAQVHRRVSLTSRAHRHAALEVAPRVRLDWPEHPHLGATYDPAEALHWACKGGLICIIRWLTASAAACWCSPARRWEGGPRLQGHDACGHAALVTADSSTNASPECCHASATCLQCMPRWRRWRRHCAAPPFRMPARPRRAQPAAWGTSG